MKYFGLVYLLGAVILAAGCAPDAEEASSASGETAGGVEVQTYEGRGLVQTITPSKSFVNIDHEEIPGFMDAMAMMFAVKDSTVLEGVAVGDSVSFVLEVGTAMPQISQMDVLN